MNKYPASKPKCDHVTVMGAPPADCGCPDKPLTITCRNEAQWLVSPGYIEGETRYRCNSHLVNTLQANEISVIAKIGDHSYAATKAE